MSPNIRSDIMTDNMNRFVRSSRNWGYFTITAITKVFSVTSHMVHTPIVSSFTSLKSVVFILKEDVIGNVSLQRVSI